MSTNTRLELGKLGGLQLAKPSQEAYPNLNFLLYGDSGVGKTLLVGMAAYVEEMSPLLLVDVEGGTRTLNHFDDEAISKIDVVRVNRWSDLQKVYDELHKGTHPYRTVALDSFSEIQEQAMASNLNAEDGQRFEATGNIPEFKDWNINTNQMRRVVRAFRDLPMNTILTCLERDVPDPRREGVFFKVPKLPSKLSKEIPAFFDFVFHMSVDPKREGANPRILRTDKTNYITAKCRVPGIPETIENPTMAMLFDMLIRNPVDLESVDGLPVVQRAQASSGGMSRKASK